MFRRHNDWVREYCSHAPERLIGVACLPLPDVDEAVAELERVAGMGIRGVAIPCAAPPDKPYHHPDYEPFWDAAEAAGLPDHDAHLHRHELGHGAAEALGPAHAVDRGLHAGVRVPGGDVRAADLQQARQPFGPDSDAYPARPVVFDSGIILERVPDRATETIVVAR